MTNTHREKRLHVVNSVWVQKNNLLEHNLCITIQLNIGVYLFPVFVCPDLLREGVQRDKRVDPLKKHIL